LFDNWENLQPDKEGNGYPDIGPEKRRMKVGTSHLLEVLRLLGMAIVESPEWQTRKKSNNSAVCGFGLTCKTCKKFGGKE
jgi:hypothetical protein